METTLTTMRDSITTLVGLEINAETVVNCTTTAQQLLLKLGKELKGSWRGELALLTALQESRTFANPIETSTRMKMIYLW
ncbi:unnamed protein product [Arabis nemorensis]|uniref:Uncharacterized protein n=1 Tax=Arabis nemorensis TaxID=586526 RepID=A0A565BY41_9BRAS|nr:unnamed protein product [Arabis nemorensis]